MDSRLSKEKLLKGDFRWQDDIVEDVERRKNQDIANQLLFVLDNLMTGDPGEIKIKI